MIELMELVIKQVKQLANPDDKPMLYIRDSEGKLILTILADGIQEDKKYLTCIALKVLKDMTKCKEMVFVNSAWMVKEIKNKTSKFAELSPSQRPDRKECYVINYFSEDKCLMQCLEFDRSENNKIIWRKETKYDETMQCESRFNPFKFTDEQVKSWMEELERDKIMRDGKREIIALPMNFEMRIYRHKGKALFEVLNAEKKSFIAIKPVKDDEKFEETIKESTELLNCVGNGDFDKANKIFEKIMKNRNKEI